MRTQRVAAKALIMKNRKVLLLKRSSHEDVYKDLWDIPGGRLSMGEALQNGLKREAKEEIGLNIKVLKPFCVWDFMADKQTQIVGVTFICSLSGRGKIRLSKEHVDFLWARPADVKKLPMDKHLCADIISYMSS